jgi:phage shock protein C
LRITFVKKTRYDTSGKEDPMTKRLYRSRTDSTIAGVCGGLGEYFGIDPTFIRILTVILVFAHGVGLLGYLIAWIVIPRRPAEASAESREKGEKVEYASWNRYIPGAVLILLGLFFLARRFYWWWDIERLWPLLLVVIGIFLVFRVIQKPVAKEGTNESC